MKYYLNITRTKLSKRFDFFVLFLLLLPQYLFAQDNMPRNSSGKLEYSEIVKVDSTDAGELYKRCKKWFAKYYKSAQNVVQIDNNNNMMGKAIMRLIYTYGNVASDMFCSYSIDIQIKDNRYKYVIEGFSFPNGGSMDSIIENDILLKDKKAKKANSLLIEQFKTNINDLINNLKASMKLADDW